MLLRTAVFLLIPLGCAFGQEPWLDPSRPVDERVNALVSRMTLEEKASQVVHLAAPIPRLKVPAYNWWTEALHGVAVGTATVFPEPIGLAASWNPPLIREMGAAIGTEARAKHDEDLRQGYDQGVGLDFWAPNINIFRDPRWGRGQETYGEDPFLTARMGVAYVEGMQGDDPKYLRVIATPKHYAVHSGPEPLRHGFDAKVSKHDMEDTYLPAFRAAVSEGHAGSVMCVYNSVNGEPGCASAFLLEDQLREKWGFQGYVVSDCDAVADIWRGHHYTATLAEAGAISMKRGTDLDCNEPGADYSRYMDALKRGALTEKELDIAVKRLFRARFLLGMFDPLSMVPYANTPMSENDSEAHRQLALKVARQTMVLLKNDGVLPLAAATKRIVVVGPLADSLRALEGNYNGVPSRFTTPLDGIRKQFRGVEVVFEPGTEFLRAAEAVPGAMLTTPDGKPGMKGEYFRGMELAGKPAVTRVDKDVNFEFGNPAPGMTAQNFSVLWTGFLTPAETHDYKLGFMGDDGYRVWLDGRLVVEDWGKHATTTRTAGVRLEAGHKYALKIEYFQDGGGAFATLIWSHHQEHVLENAVAAAKKADAVVAVVGITSELEGEEMKVTVPGFEGGDRTTLDLPKDEEDVLKAVKATGKPLVVVLMNGSPLAVNWARDNANAILEAWYPGEEGGAAIAETLAGVNNPAGRLPVTFYKDVNQLPPFTDYSMEGRTYRYSGRTPLYPFGFGMSYTKFTYSGLKLSSHHLAAGATLAVEADVTNTGLRAGDEVVQVYLTFPKTPGAPLRALRGFTRVHLDPGKAQRVRFTLDPRDLSHVDPAGDRVVTAGDYDISVGGGQPGTGAAGLEARFSIAGETAKLQE
ncbi:MAG TPA: glycoside hydrolase family 3 C-terminal domain-containing protein [Bryobacteraceae bacterium]|nr:glycoside hydrolase family 3 C-terminal domain-containing protein [Bryobacteraceae bacterium]